MEHTVNNEAKQTMSDGSALVVTETCLPIKVYVGHILNLLDKGIDKIFVPSIQSIVHSNLHFPYHQHCIDQ